MQNLTNICISDSNKTFIEVNKQIIHTNKKYLEENSKIFSLLGNEVRLKIVFLIMKNEKLCVCDISDILQMKQSPISQHLRKLKDAGVLENYRDGLTIFYFIPGHMIKKLESIIEV